MSSNSVCVDASFIIRLVTSNVPESSYRQKWNQWQQANYQITAPTLIHYEVSNGIYRYHKAGQITAEETSQLIEDALALKIMFYGDAELHRQALAIAQTYSLPATYDAHYLALAQRLDLELWTADRRLFNSVQPSLSWVNLLV